MHYQSSTKSFRGIVPAGVTCGCFLVVALYLAACSSTNSTSGTGGNSGAASGMASVNLHISDPATCEAPAGPFSHVYVTITDVQVSTSSSAGANDSGWVDLTPHLSSAPKQIDLLGQANNQCFLADLGDALQLQPGSYQQIRLILAPDGTSISNNACGSDANCVVLAADNSVHDLLLSSEAKTGIKIPSGQIAGGEFTIAAGQTMDLDIDFSTCESIVQEGNGKYRLKPVLHAGEVSTTSTSINGMVLDSVTGNVVNGTVLIALEQKDSTGVDRIQRSALAGLDGSFVFCPLPSGTYDVVIVGARSDGALYQPTVVTGVSVGSTVSTVDLYPPAAAMGSVLTLAGTVTSQNASNAGTVADIQLSVLETISGTTYTIPLPPVFGQSSAALSLETASSTNCATGTDCAMYSMQLPSGGPYIGAWSSGGITLSLSSSTVSYVVDGMAFVPSSGGTADCNPSELKAAAYGTGSTGPVQTLAFMQCQ
jgi:Domain of unknown function (DUF4382)